MNEYRSLELPRKSNKKKEDYKYFVGSTEKDPLSYKAGETMVFKIRAKYMDDFLSVPYIWYSLETEDGQKEEGHKVAAADGWFYIEASISKNGFVYLKAKACDENKQIFTDIEEYNGSAGANVSEILRATKTPEDYLEFWETMHQAVKSNAPGILYSQRIEDGAQPDFEIYDMRLSAPESEYVSVMVAYPKAARKGSLKFAMFFQGYGVNPATPMPMQGYFTVSVNAHCMPNGESEAYYANLRDRALKGYAYDAEENKRPETCYFAKMLLRNLAALRFFEGHALLNGQDYCFIGSSQGGMQACNMAAHYEKSTAVILNVPWLSDINGHELAGRHKNSMPKGAGVAYFDTAVAAQFLKCPAYIIAGLGDLTCNPSTEMALFNSIRTQKYIEFYQNKIHSFTIPWDNLRSALGDESLAKRYTELTDMYYDFN